MNLRKNTVTVTSLNKMYQHVRESKKLSYVCLCACKYKGYKSQVRSKYIRLACGGAAWKPIDKQ